MRKDDTPKSGNSAIADELEYWAIDGALHGNPDILSMTEVVAENWQAIVTALRSGKRAGCGQ